MAATGVDRREIVSLALPAFLALVAEPLYLAADSAIVGHLGTIPLAGLSVAAAVLTAGTGLFIFLAYATTSTVARHVGAGQPGTALARGLDGLWLSLAVGILAAAVLSTYAAELTAGFGATAAAAEQSAAYLRIAAWGVPGVLAGFAATGTLRGLLDTRTPLVVSVIGFAANVALNLWFVHGLHWGITGSAWGTLAAQTGLGLTLAAVVLRRARAAGASLRPHPGGVLAAARGGIPLLIRTIALRVALLLTIWAAAHLGDAPMAAHQIAATVWSLLAFALDALAIAAQAIIGRDLGAGQPERARAASTLLLRWGTGLGLAVGAATAALAWVLARAISPDPAVQSYAVPALLVVAAGQVLAGYVFVADGVLMGAGDFGYLATAMVLALAAYLPVVLFVRALGVWGEPGRVLVLLWVGYGLFIGARAVGLWWRLRRGAWAGVA